MEITTYRVPLVFTAAVIEKRCRNVERTWQYRWVDVPVGHADPDEFPEVASWLGEDGRRHAARWDGVRHLCALQTVDGNGVPSFLTADGFAAAIAAGDRYCPIYDPKAVAASSVMAAVPEFDPERYRSVLTETSGEAYEAMMERASTLTVIDGLVWQSCGEPVYVLSRSRPFSNVLLSRFPVVIDFLGKTGTEDPKRLFRLDRGDDYLAAIEDKTGTRPDPDSLAEIHMPGTFSYRDEEAAFVAAFSELCETARSGIGRRPHAEIRAWVDLDEALGTAGGAVTDWLVQMAEQYASAMEDSYWKNKARAALDRWNNRPIEIELPRIGA